MWYSYLLEQTVTTRQIDEEGRREQVPTRVEEKLPSTPWGESYRLSRLKGLSPDHKSVLFKLINELLPSRERVNRILPNTSPLCVLCNSDRDTYLHSFFDCRDNCEAAALMLRCAQVYNTSLTETQALRLELSADLTFVLPITVILASGFSLIWDNRKEKKPTGTAGMKCEITWCAKILTSSKIRRIRAAGQTIANILDLLSL